LSYRLSSWDSLLGTALAGSLGAESTTTASLRSASAGNQGRIHRQEFRKYLSQSLSSSQRDDRGVNALGMTTHLLTCAFLAHP